MMFKRTGYFTYLALCSLVLALISLNSACVKGELSENQPPDTRLSVDTIILSGDNRLNSSVTLSWFGNDVDGYVIGYEVSVDEQNWQFTTSQDSTILFDIPAGQDTADVYFYVRAIDNDQNTDPSPAALRVPLKNAPPVATILDNTAPKDSAFIVSTFGFDVSDPDGDASVSKVEMRFNNGDWFEVSLGESLLSFVIDTAVQSGPATADLYYGTERNPALQNINGLLANDLNYVQIRATDVAGATSPVDTAEAYYLKNKTPGTDLLWVSGQITSARQTYESILNNIGAKYELLNYGSDLSSDRLPAYWDPTFRLISSLYPKMFVTADRATYTNPVTNRTASLINFLAPVIQYYSNNGGKSFITTSFGINDDVQSLIGPYPIAGLETQDIGRARIFTDSSLVPLEAGYPELTSENVQLAIVPIIANSDAQNFYRAELNNGQNPWTHSDIVAVARRPSNILTQVFFAVEIHQYKKSDVTVLLDEILINEF